MEDIDIAEYKKSLSELYEILKHLPIEARNKIPDEELKFYESNRDLNYQYIYDTSLSVNEQKLMDITIMLIANIYVNYWAENKEELQEISTIVKDIIENTDFSYLYSKEHRIFSIGFNIEENKLTDSYYDLLASEARQASLVAIAKNDVPSKHWNNLSRTLTVLRKYKGLISWSGTAFEYLMPNINIPRYKGSLLDESCKFAIMNQIEYSQKLGIPWGISEAAFNLKDLQGNYQYKAFGIPWLGLKRGLADEMVSATYGSVLAITDMPTAVLKNLKELEKQVEKKIEESGYEIDNFKLQVTNRPDLGEYQINDAMQLAKKYHKNPREIAEDITEKLEELNIFTNINIAGPGFINVSLSDEFLISIIEKMSTNIESNIDKQEKKTIVLDYGGANVAKALHVGHLRSANIGEALKRLARLLGHTVISDAHLGDYGRPLGLVILEIKKRYPNLEYFNEEYTGDYKDIELPITNKDLEEIYPIASTKAKEDEAYLEEARIITTKLQNHERGYYDIWQRIIEISKEEIKKVYDELNVYYDLWEGESNAAEYVDDLIEILESKNLVEISDGAKIIDVKEDDDKSPMPPLLLVKSNGSISYETTDLATILERKKKIDPDEIWYCVDGRQQLHFEQVFRAARKANLVSDNVKLEYIGFGTMNGKDGKPFKTRDGGVMSLKSLIDEVKKETEKRINKDIVAEENIEETVDKIAISTLKYADLIPFRTTDYIFDPEKFSEVEGKTGPYLLYSTVRMASLLNKATDEKQTTYKKVKNKTDRNIILTLLELPNVLTRSFEMKSLNEIADYLYDLTSKYNKFYSENKVLTEEDEDLKESWLVLTNTVYKTNLLLLDTLGLKVPEKM